MIGLSAQSFLLKRWLFFGLFSLLAAVTLVRAEPSDVKLSYEERAWIAAHQQQVQVLLAARHALAVQVRGQHRKIVDAVQLEPPTVHGPKLAAVAGFVQLPG